jgi:hypothetical protein
MCPGGPNPNPNTCTTSCTKTIACISNLIETTAGNNRTLSICVDEKCCGYYYLNSTTCSGGGG